MPEVTDEPEKSDDSTVKEVDYGSFSNDPRRWNNKEKSINAYGKYRDEDGIFHSVYRLRGDFRNNKHDYNIDIASPFSVTNCRSDLAQTLYSTGELNITLCHLNRFVNGKPRNDDQLVKISGNKGVQWFEAGDIEYRRTVSNVETIPGAQLKDDQSISSILTVCVNPSSWNVVK